jgi:hypothetical protein
VIRPSGFFGAGASEPALLVDGRNVLVSGSAESKNMPDSSGLSGAAIAGIVIGVIVLLGSAALAGVWYHKTKIANALATATPLSPSAAPHPPVIAHHCEAIPVATPIVTNTAAHITELNIVSQLSTGKADGLGDQSTFVGREELV